MPLLYGILGLICAGGGAGITMVKLPVEEEKKQRSRIMVCLLAASGFLMGWMISNRVDNLMAGIRLFLVLSVLAGAVYTDLNFTKIPNMFSLILLGGFLVLTIVDAVFEPERALALGLGGLFGVVVMFLLTMLCRFVSRGGIGYGDVKILTALGAILGIYGTFSLLLFAQIGAVVCSVGLLLMKKATIKDGVPFAPFFYLGYAVTLVLGTF